MDRAIRIERLGEVAHRIGAWMAGDGVAVVLPAKDFDVGGDSVVLRTREGDDNVQRATADSMVTVTPTLASENGEVDRTEQGGAPAA